MKADLYMRASNREPDTYRKVQIVTTEFLPLQLIIGGFYTTAFINIITWNKAYCMFAKTTFIDGETYPLVKLDTYHVPLHAKVTARGWPWAKQDGRWEDGKLQTETYDCWLGKKSRTGGHLN